MSSATSELIRKLILFGLVSERFTLGLAAALRPSALPLGKPGSLFTRGFGIRHFALGVGLLSLQKDKKHLAQFATLNAAIEAADGLAILAESKQGRISKSLALGSLVGAVGCLALAAVTTASSESSS